MLLCEVHLTCTPRHIDRRHLFLGEGAGGEELHNFPLDGHELVGGPEGDGVLPDGIEDLVVNLVG